MCVKKVLCAYCCCMDKYVLVLFSAKKIKSLVTYKSKTLNVVKINLRTIWGNWLLLIEYNLPYFYSLTERKGFFFIVLWKDEMKLCTDSLFPLRNDINMACFKMILCISTALFKVGIIQKWFPAVYKFKKED